MARVYSWSIPLGRSGSVGTAPNWILDQTSAALPNGHTLIRLVRYGSVFFKNTGIGVGSDAIPPSALSSELKLTWNNRIIHLDNVPFLVSFTQLYDWATAQRVYYFSGVTDSSWQQDFMVNHKIPASGTNTITWTLRGAGPTKSTGIGSYFCDYGVRALTLSP